MLKKFSVTNYRQFEHTLSFDLSASNYGFNLECIKQGLVKFALIYGENGSGKSNLGWAMYDLVSHLTDNENTGNKQNFLNALSKDKYSTFKFDFVFLYKKKNVNVEYIYQKNTDGILITEKLFIADELVLDYHLNNYFTSHLKGTENLNKTINPAQNLSAVKYVYNNTSLDKRDMTNAVFDRFMEFVNHILYFRNVIDAGRFAGFGIGLNEVSKDIIKNNNLKDFQEFLNDCGIVMQLCIVESFDEKKIGVKLGDKRLDFFEVASTGTKNLAFFYYWWQNIKKDKIPLLFIDEFDASYHFALSEKIIEKLKQLPNTQVILTTHNTNLLNNDFIRPDCGFVIDGKQIKSLNNLTDKEIRQVHNLEKLYIAGHFTHE